MTRRVNIKVGWATEVKKTTEGLTIEAESEKLRVRIFMDRNQLRWLAYQLNACIDEMQKEIDLIRAAMRGDGP